MTQRLFASLILLGALSTAASVHAQIDRPGAHRGYSAELEPHLVLQWSDEPPWGSDGLGLGLRATFPVIQDGPVRTINNSLGVGVGFDWSHFGDNCRVPGAGGTIYDCSGNDFWIPVVVQWNFFFSDLISAFPELGLALQHSSWNNAVCVRANNDWYYCGDGSDNDLELVLWLGVRFHLAENFALTLRLGTPSVLFGASFFL